MELVPDRPNVELRPSSDGERIVVLAFPYDRRLVEQVRTIPNRRFDWATREWFGAGRRLGRAEGLRHPRRATPS